MFFLGGSYVFKSGLGGSETPGTLEILIYSYFPFYFVVFLGGVLKRGTPKPPRTTPKHPQSSFYLSFPRIFGSFNNFKGSFGGSPVCGDLETPPPHPLFGQYWGAEPSSSKNGPQNVVSIKCWSRSEAVWGVRGRFGAILGQFWAILGPFRS